MDLTSTLTVGDIARKVEILRSRYRARDARLRDVQLIRRGDFDAVAPGLFNEEWPRPIVANMIDTSARHFAGALAPLPTFNCSSSAGTNERARKAADKRTKIVRAYARESDLETQMLPAADQFTTYGLIVGVVEPDFDDQTPLIYHEDSIGFYPEWDRRGRTVAVARSFWKDLATLKVEYPEIRERLERPGRTPIAHRGDKVEVIKYEDAKRIVMYLKGADDCVLIDGPNPFGECRYVCTKRPGLDDEIRGAYDDLIWVQLARHYITTLGLEGTEKSVSAPWVVPPDVGDVPVGPDAIIRTSNPAGVGKVNVNFPQAAFAVADVLKSEMLSGSITPESLSGSVDASVITGQGLQQLQGGFSQQVASAQDGLKRHYRELLRKCMKMDELMFGDVSKTIRGMDEGTPFEETYTPNKDIAGNYTVDINYGFTAGLDANRALVYLLQAQGAGLVSADYVRRNLPAQINASEEARKIEVEQLRGGLVASLGALSQAIPGMVQQGMDPTQIITTYADAITRINKGENVESVIAAVFAPKEDPAAAAADPMAAAGAPQDPMAALAAQAGGGVDPSDPSAMGMYFAGINSSGNPNLSATVSRQVPI